MSSEGLKGIWFLLRAGELLARLLLRRDCQPKHRGLSLPRHIQTADPVRVGQIQGLAVLAAIHFRIRPPGLLGVAAGLLEHIRGVEPALEMSTAELALGILLVAGALPWLLEFHFVMRKLRGSGCGCGQKRCPRRCGKSAAGYTSFILLEQFYGMPGRRFPR